MKLARIRVDGSVWLARREEEQYILLRTESDHVAADAIREALADEFDFRCSGEPIGHDDAELLAPIARPSKIIAIGLNYPMHVRESSAEPPTKPLVFVKTPNSLIGPGEAIVVDNEASSQVDYEAELVAIIGKRARHVDRARALDHVLGYTAGNDVSARDVQFSDGQWVRGKSFDTFCPLGPWIVTRDEISDPQSMAIGTDLNGDRLQNDNTANMIFDVATIISYVSKYITLEPGDLVFTGTPDGVGFARTPPRYLSPGGVVSVFIEQIGALTNPIVAG